MAYFEKFLTPVDVKKQVAIPSDFVKHLPEYKGGRTINFPVRDVAVAEDKWLAVIGGGKFRSVPLQQDLAE
ncbi:hypothetical protein V6N12_054690 [Hibiscus sabdariffa]|uniref:Uncharacterized protein n=1 Tax=Hibiscus sabdariffa TaxID=183260 RepID=A0ABR2D181_9ROSI